MPPPWNQFEGFYWLSRDSGESHVGVSNFERNCWMADSSWAWICLRLAFLISRATSSFSPRFISSFFLPRNLFEALRFCSFLRSRGSVGSCESEDRRLFGLGNLSLSPPRKNTEFWEPLCTSFDLCMRLEGSFFSADAPLGVFLLLSFLPEINCSFSLILCFKLLHPFRWISRTSEESTSLESTLDCFASPWNSMKLHHAIIVKSKSTQKRLDGTQNRKSYLVMLLGAVLCLRLKFIHVAQFNILRYHNNCCLAEKLAWLKNLL